MHLRFPWWLNGKESTCNAGDPGSFPGLGRSLREGNSNPLQYSCLENPMDRGAWWATAHGVTHSRARLHTHAHACTHDAGKPLARERPDQPSASVAGLLQRTLQREEAGVLQTVSTRCAARPHRGTRWGPSHLGPTINVCDSPYSGSGVCPAFYVRA